ncbi:hypothetical protein [Flammeovirga agarivorans]|uniref:Lipoprotein n=1 Tax=Flammeovirga agarivorans TaxID=2726742 RepID=A0A7X8SRG7_9BACT|nr:hypothetical protein [Flammeovirga agarivorans]NLR95020.1 hypothetical protein [Flammeovirga agarivorans]
MIKIIFLVLCNLLFISCSTSNSNKNYIERKTGFDNLKDQNILTNKWLRKESNLLMVHETVKAFGYKKLIKKLDLNSSPIIYKDIYLKKELSSLIDSLILSYNTTDIEVKYYNEFWNRRKVENNEKAVFKILNEIQKSMNSEKMDNLNSNEIVNDTLLSLLSIEYNPKTISDSIANMNYNKLKSYGFHQSAYNLLFERYEYYDIDWNKDKLKNGLIESVIVEVPFIKDNTK